MNFTNKVLIYIWLLPVIFFSTASAQDKQTGDTSAKYKIISAGPQYKRSGWHQLLWGKNYRKEWTTPVRLPVFLLENEKGGLIPEKEGGGHQTTSLHLKTKEDKNYSLRSVDKRLGKVLPKEFIGTFIEHLVNDEVSMSHPYAAATVPGMAEAAGIYHTTPIYVYLPKQTALDTFDSKYGNNVYLFEQRIKGDWSDDNNLGNFDDFDDTAEMMKKLFSETENSVDQRAFLRARLFDIFLGDWDRHEDQWAWGVKKDGDKKIFVPLPQDRDQVYFKHNGLILDIAIAASGFSYFQSFKNKIGNVNKLTYEERGIDRLFTNQLNYGDWEAIGKALKESLTDEVIEQAVKKLPPEIYAIDGEKITAALKARREQIPGYTKTYYEFLAKEVEIVGTKGTEYFDVSPINDNEVSIKLFNKTKEGNKKKKPFYSRTFLAKETKEVRLYGLSGEDVYTIDGNIKSPIKIRIIGGTDADSVIDNTRDKKIYLYDDKDDANYVSDRQNIKLRLSNDTGIHSYVFRSFMYDKRGIKPTFFYSDEDRFYVGLGYGWEHHKWRKLPYAFKQDISVHYSLSQKAFSLTYKGLFPNAIGKFNLALLGNLDAIRWRNFYGLGNETLLTTKDKDYNRMQTREAIGSVGINRQFGNNFVALYTFYNSVKIINDADRYVAKQIAPGSSKIFDAKNFAGAAFTYYFQSLNDKAAPTKGITLAGNASFTQNVNETDRSFWTYGGKIQLYIPLVSKFSLAVSSGASTVSGNPEFYQYPEIGGGMDLRGFQRQRFYGKTAFWNSNELRFITNLRT
ncbi:MAG: outer membrane protein assembly factor, partial [Bacteroidota bacterium]|nr:outer membrane protein assembly factor [Bacteroidota bacterium]